MLNCFQIYTGNGKGKTTASLGLALRNYGNGGSVYIGQFLKKGDYSEITALESLDKRRIEVKQFGSGKFIFGEPSENDIVLAKKGLDAVKLAILSGRINLVICDEINGAISLNLVTLKEAMELVELSKSRCELVFTGRSAHKSLIEIADLVTEMKEVKHYMNSGVEARKGIEL